LQKSGHVPNARERLLPIEESSAGIQPLDTSRSKARGVRGLAPKDSCDDLNTNENHQWREIKRPHGGKHTTNGRKYRLCGLVEKVDNRKKRTTRRDGEKC